MLNGIKKYFTEIYKSSSCFIFFVSLLKICRMELKQLFKALPSDPKLIKREVKAYVIITLCLALYAFSLVGFIINAEIVGGGVNGVGTLIYYGTGKFIPVAYSVFVINALLLILGFKILGSGFGIKTVYAVTMMAVFLGLAQEWVTEPFLGVDETFLSAVIGGVLTGVSVGTSFNYGGSTGGTDILALIVSKFRNISPGRVILYADVVIITSSFFVFYVFMNKTPIESFRIVVYGFVVMVVVSYTIDLIVLGAQQSIQLFIFSKKHEVIADMISSEIQRGVTVIDGKGWYSKENVEVIMVVVRKYEIQSLLRRIRDLDPDAFTSVTNASGVYGKGFDRVK